MKKKLHKKRYLFLAVILVLAALMCPSVFAGNTPEKTVIRVGYMEKGMVIKENNGRITGYGASYLNRIAQYTNWEYEYVPIEEATRINALKNGEIDLLCDVSEDEVERDDILLSADRNCMHYALICAREDDTSIFYNEFSAINGKRIAVNRSRKMDRMLEDFARIHNITYTPVYCASISQLEDALKEGRADLMVASNQRDLNGYKFVAKAGLRNQYFAMAKENALLMEQLNDADTQIKLQQPFYISSLYETWYGRPAEVLVGQTREEYEFIQSQTPVRVVCDADSFPVEYQDPESGRYLGVFADALELIRQESGLNFQYLPLENYQEAWDMLKNEEADMSSGMYLNEEMKEKYALTAGIPHLTCNYTLILRADKTLDDELTVVLPEDALDIEAFVLEQYPVWNVIHVQDNSDCLDACESGQADCTFIDSIFLQTVYNFNNFKNLEVCPMHSVDIPISCAFAGKNAPLLVEIVNKAIRRIPKTSFENCIVENSVEIAYEPSMADIMHRIFPALLAVIAGFILLYLISLRYKEEHYRHLSMTDTVTGLWNDICFRQNAKEYLAGGVKKDHQMISMDIDHFRYINADYGEKIADIVLKTIGVRLHELFGKDAMYAREMGDIFLILTKTRNDLPDILQQLRQDILLDTPGATSHYRPDLKFGICNIPAQEKMLSINEYIDRSNIARKSIKGSSTEKVAIFDSRMQESISVENEIEKKMVGALENKEFLVYYQPKYSLQTDSIVGAEALVRWKDPEKGMIFPNTFIPIFERNGFIVQLDFFVYEEVLQTLAKWLEEGRPPIVVSVNVSRTHIGTSNFLPKLVSLADFYGVPHHLLELELTETVLGGDHQDILTFIKSCKDAGFPVSIDDFGSGYSSLNLLKELPVDVLKIDREFLNEANVSEKSSIIIEEIILMATKIDIHTLCEGVETLEQANFLRRIGCNMAQGYYYSRPIPLADFEALL